jgi:hypothetical protein
VGGHEHHTCPGQGTAGLELAGATEGVATGKAEALEPREQGKVEYVLLLREDPIEGKRGACWSLRETL